MSRPSVQFLLSVHLHLTSVPLSLRLYHAADKTVETIIGKEGPGHQPAPGHRDGLVREAHLLEPKGLARLSNGCIIIADSGNHCIRIVDARLHDIATIAGNAARAGHADGRGSAALFHEPTDVLVARDRKTKRDIVYVTDTVNAVIRKLELVIGADGRV